MPNRTDESAPQPWLSATSPAGATTPVQTWSSSSQTMVFSYPFEEKEYARHLSSQMGRVRRKLVVVFTLIGFVLGALSPLTAIMIRQQYPRSSMPMGPTWRSTLMFWAEMTIGIPVFGILLLYLLTRITTKDVAKRARGKRFFITLSAQGIEHRLVIVHQLRWTDIRAVDDWEDGILLRTAFGKPSIGVPGSAFVDGDATKRFGEAVRLLWQSGGDVRQVPPTTRAEFAAPPSS